MTCLVVADNRMLADIITEPHDAKRARLTGQESPDLADLWVVHRSAEVQVALPLVGQLTLAVHQLD